MAEVKRGESGALLRSVSFPRGDSRRWTSEADAAKGLTVNLPETEHNTHQGQRRPLPPLETLPPYPRNSQLVFLKGQPQVLGVAQILIGLMKMYLWVTSVASYNQISFRGYNLHLVVVTGYPVWGSFFFFTSGALSIAAGRKVTKCLIQGSLGMNIISVIVAGVGIIILALTAIDVTEEKNGGWFYEEHLHTIKETIKDLWSNMDILDPKRLPVWQGLVTVMLILSLLEACIALSLSIFGCRLACFVNQVVVFLPSQDSMASVASPEHIYDDVTFQ